MTLEIKTEFFHRALYYNTETKVYETEGSIVKPTDDRLVKYLQYSTEQYAIPEKTKLMREVMMVIIEDAKQQLPKNPEDHYHDRMEVPVVDPILLKLSDYLFTVHEGEDMPTAMHKIWFVKFRRRRMHINYTYAYSIWDAENIDGLIPKHWEAIEERHFQDFLDEAKFKLIKAKQRGHTSTNRQTSWQQKRSCE